MSIFDIGQCQEIGWIQMRVQLRLYWTEYSEIDYNTSTDSLWEHRISYHPDGWVTKAGRSREHGSGDEAGKAVC